MYFFELFCYQKHLCFMFIPSIQLPRNGGLYVQYLVVYIIKDMGFSMVLVVSNSYFLQWIDFIYLAHIS